jgi:hypothetical protein
MCENRCDIVAASLRICQESAMNRLVILLMSVTLAACMSEQRSADAADSASADPSGRP